MINFHANFLQNNINKYSDLAVNMENWRKYHWRTEELGLCSQQEQMQLVCTQDDALNGAGMPNIKLIVNSKLTADSIVVG